MSSPTVEAQPTSLHLGTESWSGWEFFQIFESISFLHFYIEIVKSNSLTSMWGLHSTLATSQSCHGLGLAFWWTFDSWLLYCQEVPWLKLLVTDMSWGMELSRFWRLPLCNQEDQRHQHLLRVFAISCPSWDRFDRLRWVAMLVGSVERKGPMVTGSYTSLVVWWFDVVYYL